MDRATTARARTPVVLAMVVLGLAGCGSFYYGKPGGTFADFSKDHQECVGELAVQTSANKAYGIVSPDLYRACMTGRGWSRRQHPEPVPEGWFRGIEDEEVIRLDTPPTQPWQKPSQQYRLPEMRGSSTPPSGSSGTDFGRR